MIVKLLLSKLLVEDNPVDTSLGEFFVVGVIKNEIIRKTKKLFERI